MTHRGGRVAQLLHRPWPWVLLTLAACRPPTETTPPDPAEPETASATAEPQTPAEPPPCGSPGTVFADHGWAPADAPAVASIRLDDPQLEPALAALSEHARAPGHGLPIPLALSLGQWSWQVPLLAATLRRAGFVPAELTFVASKEAAHAWVWRSTCDLDEAVERIESAWSVSTRRTVDAVIGTPQPAAEPTAAFPYDVLLLPGERMALVPAGRASSALARLTRPAPAPSLGAGSTTPGRRLDRIEPAPVRLVVQGLALVDAAAPTAPGDAVVLRVTAEGVVSAPPPASDASVGDPS